MRKKIYIILILALSLRIGLNMVKQIHVMKMPFLLSGSDYNRTLFSDEKWYGGSAAAFLNGKGVLSIEKEILQKMGNFAVWVDIKEVDRNYYAHKFVPPVYPLFLSFCYLLLGKENTIAHFIPQLMLSSLTCVLIFLLTKEVYNEKAGFLAGIIMACYPDLIFCTYLLHTETLFIFLLVLGFLLTMKGLSGKNVLLIYIGVITITLACLTRIVLLPFLPVLFFWIFFIFRKDKNRRYKVVSLSIVLSGLILLSWCARNYFVFGKFTPLTDEISSIFFEVADSIKQEKNEYFFAAHPHQIERITQYIMNDLNKYFLSSLKRFFMFWSPFTPPMQIFAKFYKGITWLIVFPTAFYGIIISMHDWQKNGILLLLILYYSVIHAFSFVDNGLVYRYPIQPFLCIFASYAFCRMCQIMKKHRYENSLIKSHAHRN